MYGAAPQGRLVSLRVSCTATLTSNTLQVLYVDEHGSSGLSGPRVVGRLALLSRHELLEHGFHFLRLDGYRS